MLLGNNSSAWWLIDYMRIFLLRSYWAGEGMNKKIKLRLKSSFIMRLFYWYEKWLSSSSILSNQNVHVIALSQCFLLISFHVVSINYFHFEPCFFMFQFIGRTLCCPTQSIYIDYNLFPISPAFFYISSDGYFLSKLTLIRLRFK